MQPFLKDIAQKIVAHPNLSNLTIVFPNRRAALFFQKDKELRVTIERYHQHIIDSQRLLTMIDVAETIQEHKESDRMKREIIFKALEIENSTVDA